MFDLHQEEHIQFICSKRREGKDSAWRQILDGGNCGNSLFSLKQETGFSAESEIGEKNKLDE